MVVPRSLARVAAGVALLAGALLWGGCRAGASYLGNRWNDFAQVLDLDVGVGVGGQAHLGFSQVLQAGMGSYDSQRMGLRDGVICCFAESRSELGLGPIYLHEVEIDDGGGALVPLRWAHFGQPGHLAHPFEWGTDLVSDRAVLDASLEAHLVLLGARIRLSPLELADWLGGWLGIDLARDDLCDVDPDECARLSADLLCGDGRIRASAVRKIHSMGRSTHGYFIYSDPSIWMDGQRAAAEAMVSDLGER